jgi:hypothetical protein
MWQTKLSGVMNPYPALTNILASPQLLGMLPVFPLEQAVYKFSLGMPSALMLMNTGEAEGPDHVLVRTPSRDYTVAQQKELLQAMGDEQSVRGTLALWLPARRQALLPVLGVCGLVMLALQLYCCLTCYIVQYMICVAKWAVQRSASMCRYSSEHVMTDAAASSAAFSSTTSALCVSAGTAMADVSFAFSQLTACIAIMQHIAGATT